jgi:hypothetical protein
MSLSASWLAWAVDWSDSEMFDDSSHGVRLAWVELMCLTKAQGRAGRVRLRVSKFAEQKRLSVEAVEEMLARAVRFGAIIRQGDEVIACNWKAYQDPSARSASGSKSKKSNKLSSIDDDFTKTSPTEQRSHPPPPKHKNPSTERSAAKPPARARGSGVYVDITKDVLEHRSLLKHWFAQESKRRDRWVSSEADWVNVQAAAAKCLSAEDVADSVGLFKWLVKGRHWNHLTDSNDDLAKTFKLDLAGLLKPAPADAPPPRNVETIRKLAEGTR